MSNFSEYISGKRLIRFTGRLVIPLLGFGWLDENDGSSLRRSPSVAAWTVEGLRHDAAGQARELWWN